MTTDDIPPETLRSAHDRLFRRVFSDPRNARGMLQRMLPAAVVAKLDWSSLQLVPGSYVDEALGPSASDLLFQVSGPMGPVLAYLLWEHQSKQDPLMVVRLLGYAGRALGDFVRGPWDRKTPLPRIVPIVLYQGVRPWAVARRLSDLCQPDPEAEELLELKLVVHQLDAEDVEILAAARSLTALARAALVAMKLVAARVDLSAHAALLARLLGEVRRADGAAGLQPLLVYLLHTRSSPRELRAIMEAADSRTRVIVQTAYEKLIAKGEARGFAKGEARGLAKGEARGKADMLVRLVRARFGEVSPEAVGRIEGASVEQLDRWAQRLLVATSVDDLLGD